MVHQNLLLPKRLCMGASGSLSTYPELLEILLQNVLTPAAEVQRTLF